MNADPRLKTLMQSSGFGGPVQSKKNRADKADHSPSDNRAFEKKGVEEKFKRHQWISEAAYFKAEKRAFKSGNKQGDWLEAEKDYAEMLAYYLSIFEEDGGMTKLNLRQLALALNIENPEGIGDMTELVRAIQKASRQRPCFRSEGNMRCQDEDCKWRTECLKLIAEWMR